MIVVCASVDSPLSLHNSLSHWRNEFHPTSHRVPFILCATKIDLRYLPSPPLLLPRSSSLSCHSRKKRDTERETQLNSSEEGIKMAKRIGAHAYVECSALTMKGVPEGDTPLYPSLSLFIPLYPSLSFFIPLYPSSSFVFFFFFCKYLLLIMFVVFSIIARVGLEAQAIKRGKKKPKVPKVPKVGLPNKGMPKL